MPPQDDDPEDTRKRSDDIDEWDADFIKVENEQLFELILAANYMDIKPLLDLGCKTVANMIKGKTPEQIREMFNVRFAKRNGEATTLPTSSLAAD